MSDLVRKLTEEARALTSEEREDLIDNLMGLDPQLEAEIEAAWAIEIKRRIDEVEAGTAASRSYEEVMADIRRRYSP